MVDFSLLPNPIINMIINYTDVVVYRHKNESRPGIYLNRLNPNDEKYKLIKNICQSPSCFGVNKFKICVKTQEENGFRCHFIIYTYDKCHNKHYFTNCTFAKTDACIKNYNYSPKTYILDSNNKYRLIVKYTQ